MINKFDMQQDIERVLVSEEDIHARIREVGAQISEDYRGKCPILVGVLKGVVPFFGEMSQAASGTPLNVYGAVFHAIKPASINFSKVLDKPSGRKVDLEPDYTCFTIPAAFVVGFGLDYEDYYRNLPYVGVLKPAVYLEK